MAPEDGVYCKDDVSNCDLADSCSFLSGQAGNYDIAYKVDA